VQSAGFAEGDFRKWVESQAPLGRVGETDDISPSAVYLASADSKYMTGETMVISGGMR
jgi:3-oxoacyl-[acyl-carrier protein] reductase